MDIEIVSDCCGSDGQFWAALKLLKGKDMKDPATVDADHPEGENYEPPRYHPSVFPEKHGKTAPLSNMIHRINFVAACDSASYSYGA